MKNVHPFVAALLLALAAPLFGKPNIVLIIADDCTFRDIGCYGGQAHTPNIDLLATEGMRFTRCFQAAPMCSPTRHNIYTGLYPVTSGAYPNHTRVEPGTKSIVHYMKALGYRVAHSGKSHVGPAQVFAWERIPANKNPDFAKVDAFVSECAGKREPFCLLLCSNEPHTPWDKGDPARYPPGEIELPPYFVDTPATRESMSRYLAEVSYFDGQVGEAMKLIAKNGLTDDTLFIVISEQGSALPFAKWTCYGNGLQSAMIARWPGEITPGSVNRAMIEYTDILPTFVEAGGGTPDPSLEGKSLLPVLAGKQDHKPYTYGIMTTRGINDGSDHFGIRTVRSDQYRFIWNLTPDGRFQNACTTSKEFASWRALAAKGDKDAVEKVKRYEFRPEFELYDVTKDPLELDNLADNPEFAASMKELRNELERWMKQCGDQGKQTEMEALDHMTGGRKKAARNKAP